MPVVSKSSRGVSKIRSRIYSKQAANISRLMIEFITIWVILCPPRKEGQLMLRYRDISTHTTDLLDLTSLTVDEFGALVPPFETAFVGSMAEWTLQGRRRQARRYTTYKNCPLPTPED